MSAFEWVAVAVVTVMSSARLTRLATYDKFPPIAWVREKYADATDGSDWQILAFCGYCMSVWVTTGVLLWGWGVGWNEPWWLANGVLGASYAAAMVMAHDGDEGEDS